MGRMELGEINKTPGRERTLGFCKPREHQPSYIHPSSKTGPSRLPSPPQSVLRIKEPDADREGEQGWIQMLPNVLIGWVCLKDSMRPVLRIMSQK